MKKLRTTAGAVVLITILGTIAFGDSPCPLPQPGQTDTPPCAVVNESTDDVTEVGQTLAQSLSGTVDTASFVEQTLIALLLF